MSSEHLPDVLRLERIETGRYRAPHPAFDPEGRGVVFSGQLLAQMIMAADREFDGRQEVKSIHAIFSRAGTYDHQIEIHAETTHAGRTFGSTTTTAYQGERLLSRGLLLMNADEPDLIRHGPERPDCPGPEELEPDKASQAFPGCETRTIPDEKACADDGTPELSFWLRATEPLATIAAQQAVLAWSQPGELIGLALRPHAETASIADAHVSLSTGVIAHTIHFLDRFDLADWVLVRLAATAAGRGRVHGVGRVHDREGRLVSSFSQDSMVRSAGPNPEPAWRL